MADAYLISIHLDRLAANFSKADTRSWSPIEARAWLIEQGFISTESGWVAEECQLDLLGRREYRVIRQTT